MEQAKFNFNLQDNKEPVTVIEEALKQVESVTKGYVSGKVAAYSGPIFPYKKIIHYGNPLSQFHGYDEEKTIDIQEYLGEQDENEYKFEVFLSVRDVPTYKYRLMFVRYTSISYPVTVVLNEDVAVAYSDKRNTVLEVKTMRELQDILNLILNSEFITTLLQSLIYEALRRETRAGTLAVKEVYENEQNEDGNP